MNYLDDWGRLTQEERNFLLTHPWHAFSIKSATTKALNESRLRFGSGSLHNGAGDAFRHCFWSAILARDIGAELALTFTSAHEQRMGLPPDEVEMDLFNNRIGIEIGRGALLESDFVVASKCMAALSNNQLRIIR